MSGFIDPSEVYHTVLGNGLRVFLLHDPRLTEAAIAVAIKAGSFQDPKDCQGLAHLAEHVLFLGTRTHPEVHSFDHWLNLRDGTLEAYTEDEETVFGLSVQPEDLVEAATRFCELFQEPLLLDATIVNERTIIEAEFRENFEQDPYRISQVLYPHFGVGNAETLQDLPHRSIGQAVRTFFEDYYHAANMSLTMVSPQSIAVLKNALLPFEALPSRPVPKVSPLPLLTEEQLNSHVRIQTIAPTRELWILCPFENTYGRARNQPLALVGFTLGLESEGSLAHYLQQKGWLFELSVDWYPLTEHQDELAVRFSLTDTGYAAAEQVLQAFFAWARYLEATDGAQSLYPAIVAHDRRARAATPPVDPLEGALEYGVNLFYMPADTILTAHYLLDLHTISEEAIAAIWRNLQPKRTRIVSLADHETGSLQEPYYGTLYSVNPLTLNLLSRMPAFKVPPRPTLAPFVPDSIQQSTLIITPTLAIRILPLTLGGQAAFVLRIASEQACAHAPSQAMLAIWVMTFLRVWALKIDNLSLLGLELSLTSLPEGLSISLSGYVESMEMGIEAFLNCMETTAHTICDPIVMEQYIRELESWETEVTHLRLSDLFDMLTQLSVYHPEEILALLPLTAKLPFLLENFFNNSKISAYAIGPITPLLAERWMNMLPPKFLEQVSAELVFDAVGYIPPNQQLFSILPKSAEESGILLYYALPTFTLQNAALAIVTAKYMETHWFHTLRTQEKLGYTVLVEAVLKPAETGVQLVLESLEAPPVKLYELIEKFLKQFFATTLPYAEEDFAIVKTRLARQLARPGPTLEEYMAQDLETLWGGFPSEFSQKALALAISALTFSDLVRYFDTLFLAEGRTLLGILTEDNVHLHIPKHSWHSNWKEAKTRLFI